MHYEYNFCLKVPEILILFAKQIYIISPWKEKYKYIDEIRKTSA